MARMKNTAKPQGCTNLKLRQLGRMTTRHYDRYVAEVGLKNTQYALLSHVVKLGPIRPGELATRMQMDASTLTRNLQLLAALGWLTIGAGDDARSRLVEATAAGHAKRGRRATRLEGGADGAERAPGRGTRGRPARTAGCLHRGPRRRGARRCRRVMPPGR